MTRWLLVFEDPESETLWLGKAIPRDWLLDGKSVKVASAPSRWGRVSYSITSHLSEGKITAQITLPPSFSAATKLRLRAPSDAKIASVLLNGKPWTGFEADDEVVTIPKAVPGNLVIEVSYK